MSRSEKLCEIRDELDRLANTLGDFMDTAADLSAVVEGIGNALADLSEILDES
jgi:hypothetical protein